jgi:hypothetical protein
MHVIENPAPGKSATVSPAAQSLLIACRSDAARKPRARRRFAWDPHGTERRAGLYAELLIALRYETFIARCQLAKAHDKDERELLAGRLDLTDTRAADIAARLHSMGAP